MWRSCWLLKVDNLHYIIFSVGSSPLPGVVTKTVLYSDNNPENESVASIRPFNSSPAHQRFVNMTPNPNATKNNKGLPVLILSAAGDGVELLAVDDMMSTEVSFFEGCECLC